MDKNNFYKDQAFEEIALAIDLGELSSLQNTICTSCQQIDFSNTIEMKFLFKELPNISDFLILKQKLSNVNKFQIKPDFTFELEELNQSQVRDFASFFAENSEEYNEFAKILSSEHNLYFDENKKRWILHVSGNNNKEYLDRLMIYLNSKFSEFGISQISIQYLIQEINQEKKESKPSHFFELNLEKSNTFDDNFNSKIRSSKWKTSQKNLGYKKMYIKEITKLEEYEANYPVSVSGVIFRTDLIDRKDYCIYKYWIADYQDAIEITHFTREKLSDDQIFHVNDYVLIEGKLDRSYDKMKNVIKAVNIIKIESPVSKRVDEAQNKRIELSVKSKMNTMDGIIDASSIPKIAANFGHSAVALTDANSVQGFPDFSASAKKNKIKPIYGAAFSVIESSNKVFLNEFNNLIIKDQEYVSFDIETTNLSPSIGEIIEFGCAIIKNNEIIEEIQFFIKSTEKLSPFTTQLTSITDKMLEDEGLEQLEGHKKIREILNNRIAIAHNANFDMHFVLQKLKDFGIEKPNTIWMDSLAISRLVFWKNRTHSLGDFAAYNGVHYEPEAAHRADYDAKVLAEAWAVTIKKLSEEGINDFDQLSKLMKDNYYERQFANQITVLAKNQAGLKELFELTSFTLTERFFKGPKLFYSDLPKSSNILIGSGGVRSPLIDAYLFSSEQKQHNLIKYFDYIEIPHPKALLNYVENDGFTLEQVQNILRKLIKDAIAFGKIPVAVSDARYESPEEKIFFKCLVYSKGIGNTSHFLYRYKKNVIIPDLHFLTTQEMLEEFNFLGDWDLIENVVIKNTHLIANLIEDNIEVIKKDLYTPKFDDSPKKLPELVYKTAIEKYGPNLPDIIQERIKKEITPIIDYGFDVVYWISHKLVKKSNDNGYLVGSRGSVGSSLVATMSGITEVNPLEPHYVCPQCKYFELANNPEITSGYDLDDKLCPKCQITMDKDGHTIPFETFLGFNADKVPDIDLNFSGEYQGEIHNEIKRLFGETHTFRAGTISTIKDKTAYGYIKKAEEENNFGYSPNFIDYLATKIVGVKRTTGQHPGGIIIIPKEFTVEDFTPINYPADDTTLDWKTTHFDFHAIHDNVLKLDILGHVDPTAIRMLERLTGVNVRTDIPKKDPKVMSLFRSTKALGITPDQIGGEATGAIGIPEFGTNFVRRMLKEAQPESFADLISLSGLSHGTDVWTNNAQTLISKQGLTIKDVISCRDDIMVYLINKGVDSLNSFKIMEKVRKGKGLIDEEVDLLKSHNIPEWYIDSLQKIKYMFPKAHATAYVLMAWRIAWFKLYYPLEYYATYFTTRVEEFDPEVIINDQGAIKVNKKMKDLKEQQKLSVTDNNLLDTLESVRELYARGFNIQNISIEKSKANEWTVDPQSNSLIPPFTIIKGLGEAVAWKIVNAREEKEFISREDFKKRSGVSSTLYGVLENLKVLSHLSESNQIKLFD
ncbi:PolC-type DNA polymerase III [Mycoplasmopsis sturni]|uniref:PolC-type DNA polymerase III n=1 Tax=Mycoplasmopsis sturni TaxID=39047 RepID=UPI00056C662C|nr:PolC-type DNA polymerase III [Mycoplasmopsis sturni]